MDSGFKSGAADDDWDDDFDGDADGDEPDSTKEAEGRSNQENTSRTTTASGGQPGRQDEMTPTSSTELPWVLTRNSITDGREQTVQLHLQDSTLDEKRDVKREVEDTLGEDVKKADLREAALLVGLRHSDEVADVLREWGYAID